MHNAMPKQLDFPGSAIWEPHDYDKNMSTEDAASFVRTCEALRHIRDNRLYRQNYDTFEDYCRKRWDLSGQLVNEYIQVADLVCSGASTAATEAIPPGTGGAIKPGMPVCWLQGGTRCRGTALEVLPTMGHRKIWKVRTRGGRIVHRYDDDLTPEN